MLGQLRHKFFSLHEEFTASVSKQLTPSSQEITNARAGPYDAGDELLEYWQVQWEAIHMAQDQNGRGAARCDRIISNIQQRIQKQWELAMKLQTMVGQIPKMNKDIEEVMKVLGNLESSFGDVEISLLALEDTIDARELQERQLDQRFQLAMYQERRKAEFNELSNRLQNDYQKKKSEYERKQLLLSQERQRESQEKFEADMRQFKVNGGRLLQVPQLQDPDASLESVDLSEDDVVAYGQKSLEAFLAEDSPYDLSPLPKDEPLHRQLSDDRSSDSSSTEKESLEDVVVKPVVDETSYSDEASNVAEGAMSRTESIYYTPDATTEKLEQLTLQ